MKIMRNLTTQHIPALLKSYYRHTFLWTNVKYCDAEHQLLNVFELRQSC